MRRLSGLLGLILFLAPVGLRLATAAGDAEAMRCAIACGHAMGARTGAACCPMSGTSGAGPTFKACPGAAEAALTPLAPSPMLLVAVAGLVAPAQSRPLDASGRAVLLSAHRRVPDKVPLRVG